MAASLEERSSQGDELAALTGGALRRGLDWQIITLLKTVLERWRRMAQLYGMEKARLVW
jgi:hypothetical protein